MYLPAQDPYSTDYFEVRQHVSSVEVMIPMGLREPSGSWRAFGNAIVSTIPPRPSLPGVTIIRMLPRLDQRFYQELTAVFDPKAVWELERIVRSGQKRVILQASPVLIRRLLAHIERTNC